MGSSEHNCGNMSSLIGGKILNFGLEPFFILFFFSFFEYYNQFGDFTNQIFVTSSFWYTMFVVSV